jgi:N-acyl-D-amino-acid deacylase
MKNKMTRRDFIKNTSRAAAVLGLGGCGLLLKGCSTKKEFDIVIKNGYVLDGLGQEPVHVDIGISEAVIKLIGEIPHSQGVHVIDAKGLIVCPGFIDAHDHSGVELLVNPKAESHVRQGITTVVSGNCGSSPFPVADSVYEEMKEEFKEAFQIDLTWRDISGFFSRLEESGSALNYATLVGHGDVRGAAMGLNDRPPVSEELEKMKILVSESINNGAIGISSGLEYSPGSYAQADELIELCKTAVEWDGIYATHMRDEGDHLIESIEETLDVARKTGIRIQVSHFKAAYPRNWDKVDEALGKLESARSEGLSVFCDRYPYTAGSTGLSFYFPLWTRQGTTDEFLSRLNDKSHANDLRGHIAFQEEKLGSWDRVVIASVFSEKNKKFEGKSVLQGAGESGKEAFEFMRDLLTEEKNRVDIVIFMMKEENLKKILSHPQVGIGCDGSAKAPYGVLGKGVPHPRSYGTFPRVLGKYIREEKILPMAEMMKKMTSIPAKNFGFSKRGALQEGYFADIVIFDEGRVIDKATWNKPHQYPQGIEYVIVNGEVVIDKEDHTGGLPGRILKKSAKA